VPGAILSFVIFTIPEPVRRNIREKATNTDTRRGIFSAYGEFITFIRTRPRFFAFHYSGFMLATFILGGGAAWYPAHMARTFSWEAGQIGLTLGLTLIVSGIIGKLASGYFVDAMYRRGRRDAQLRWYAICLLIATPVGIFATTSGNPWVFLIGIGALLILLSQCLCATQHLSILLHQMNYAEPVSLFPLPQQG